MDHRSRTILAAAGVVGMFLVVQLGSLALVEPFQQEGHQVVEDTGDPTISILYIAAILGVTLLALAAFRYGGEGIIRALILFAAVFISFYVFQVVVPALLTVTAFGFEIHVIATAAAMLLGAALFWYPEWYVIDAAGIVLGIGAAGLFGVNFGLLPALVLLVVLAIYDAISVYGTEHMLTLASGMMEMRVPVLLVVPLSRSYSFLEETTSAGATDDGSTPALDVETLEELGPAGVADLEPARLRTLDEETIDALEGDLLEAVREQAAGREALYIGLGDAVIPTILVASAGFFIETGPTVSLLGLVTPLPAVTAMVGTLVGLVCLLLLVLRGRAHAGLPLLNGGAIGGYLVGAFLSGMTLLEALGLAGLL